MIPPMVDQLNKISPERDFLRRFFCDLKAAGICYVVMRNYDLLPDTVAGSDLDIIVVPDDKESLMDILFRSIASSNGVAIGCTSSHGFFKVFAFGHNSTENKSWWGVCIDVNVGYSFKGAEIIRVNHISEFQRVHNGVQVLTPDLAAVLGVLKEVLNNDHIPERYLEDANRAVRIDWAKLNLILQPMGKRGLDLLHKMILGDRDSARVSANAKALRRAINLQNVKRSAGLYLRGRLLHEWAKARRYFHPSGAIIAVLGADGVGKSTVISTIEPMLRDATHGALVVKHLRPGLLPPLARLKGRKVEQVGPVLDPHGSKPSGLLGSIIRLIYLTADYVLGYWLLLRPMIAKCPAVVLFDRYCYDMAIDPRRFRIGLNRSVVDWFLRLIPKPDMVLCLHAEPGVIALRKQDLSNSEISRQLEALREFAQSNPRAFMISTEGTPEEVRDRVLVALLNFFAQWGSNKRNHD